MKPGKKPDFHPTNGREGETATFLSRCPLNSSGPDMFQPFDRLQIVTVQKILDGASMNLPLVEEVTKKAQKAKKDDQPTLLSE